MSATSQSIVRIPRESNEFVPVVVLVDGEAADPADVEVFVSSERGRPPDYDEDGWEAAVVLAEKPGFMSGGREPGTYKVWSHVKNSYPESPVNEAGLLVVT